MKKYIKIARPDHWIKQMFVFPGCLFALLLAEKRGVGPGVLLTMMLGFLSTCFIASANYVINEWLDAEFDKYHPTKKYRSVVTEDVKGKIVYAEYDNRLCLWAGGQQADFVLRDLVVGDGNPI